MSKITSVLLGIVLGLAVALLTAACGSTGRSEQGTVEQATARTVPAADAVSCRATSKVYGIESGFTAKLVSFTRQSQRQSSMASRS
jgi:NhaP-type Na+/H+ or K+/H+ antiporter